MTKAHPTSLIRSLLKTRIFLNASDLFQGFPAARKVFEEYSDATWGSDYVNHTLVTMATIVDCVYDHATERVSARFRSHCANIAAHHGSELLIDMEH